MSHRPAEALYRLLMRPFAGLGQRLRHGSWRFRLAAAALTLVLLSGTGLLFAWSGLVPVAASSGHWPLTDWLLHFTMRSSVRTQSASITPPPLDDPSLVLKGAGHYATGCAFCHGAPGQERSLIVERMTPAPPFLPPRIAEWGPEELFWIVKNGIKFTAMPAWPALGREDEVWALVAFLEQLPGMSPQRYRELALGPGAAATVPRLQAPTDAPDALLADCARCHGDDGLGRGLGAYPKLAGQREAYLLASLRAYASGTRQSGIMQPIVAGLDDQALQALARHYAGLPAPATQEAPPAPPAQGEALARQGLPERGVPGCVHCHGPTSTPRNRQYPEIAGQYPGYLALQLQLFRDGLRGGSEYAHVMHSAARRLDDEQIEQLARYYGAQPWSSRDRPAEPR